MSDNYLGKTHRYFSLSDYEVDPHSRYRKRIFHEGPPSRTKLTKHTDECVRHPTPWEIIDFIVNLHGSIESISAPKPGEECQARDYSLTDACRKRRRESSVDGYVTDGSYVEMPPMSPFSPAASIFEGVEDIGDESDSPSASDRERVTPSTPGRLDFKGKEPAFPPKLPISVRPLPKITTTSARLSSAPSASSSITEYSNSRLAERARLASLPTMAHTPAMAQAHSSSKALENNSSKVCPHSTGQAISQEGRQMSRYLTVQSDLSSDPLHAVRTRRATISGTVMDAIPSIGAPRSGNQEPADEPVSADSTSTHEPGLNITPEIGNIKLERITPPPLDLNAPEQPYSATRVAELAEGSVAPEAEFSRRRKRSKSTASPIKEREQSNSVEPEAGQSRRRGDRGPTNQVFRRAIDSGDYIQVSDNGWMCRVHGDHLGGPRSVTRHHESVHLNIVVECEYCSAQFSRRDAVLRHQRQSSCRTNAKLKA